VARREARPSIPRSLTLQQAADRLGVHYMTAYRYVRTGRLPAFKVGVQWRVNADDLASVKSGRRGAGGLSRRWTVDQVADRLVAGDEPGVWALVEAALASGAEPVGIHVDLLAPALRSIGDRWALGELSVADEHRASVVAQRIVGRLGPMFGRRGRRRGTLVLGAPPGDLHSLPSAMVADELRAARFEVVDLGANTPVASFAGAARVAVRLVAVLVGATVPAEQAIVEVIGAIRGVAPGVPVFVGGAAVAGEEAALALGADGWSGLDARQAVAAVERLPGRRPATRSRPRSSGRA
jgi:MerR family transcriptional regulator, light-induced transcriptional regulator